MAKIVSKIDTRSTEFADNRAAMEPLVEDLKAVRGIVSKDDYREVLECAPAGVFDVRSWAYWNLVCDRQPTPPLPIRTLPPTRPMPR